MANHQTMPFPVSNDIDSLYRVYNNTCIGMQHEYWLQQFKKALSIYQSGQSLRRGYNSVDPVVEWFYKQKLKKTTLEPIKQMLIGIIDV